MLNKLQKLSEEKEQLFLKEMIIRVFGEDNLNCFEVDEKKTEN